MRAGGNSALGENVTTGMVVDGVKNPGGVYDIGAKWTPRGDYLIEQVQGSVDPALAAYIQAGAGGANSSYNWDPVTLGDVTPGLPSRDDIFSMNNPYTPKNLCISADCISQGRPGAGPDYLSVSANFYLFCGGGAINLHNGDMVGQWGLGRSYPGYSIKPGGTIMFGYIIGGANSKSTNSFLHGAGRQGSVILPFPLFPLIGAGGGVNQGYGGGTSIEYGIGRPGVGVTPVGYGFDVNDKQVNKNE